MTQLDGALASVADIGRGESSGRTQRTGTDELELELLAVASGLLGKRPQQLERRLEVAERFDEG